MQWSKFFLALLCTALFVLIVLWGLSSFRSGEVMFWAYFGFFILFINTLYLMIGSVKLLGQNQTCVTN